ncbi:uncharacterized protein ACBT44_012214 isoform 4-T4 [Syngnathus typhle]
MDEHQICTEISLFALKWNRRQKGLVLMRSNGSHYVGSGDCYIRGDNLMNMNYRAPLHMEYMQPAHLNIGPAGDVTKQYMNYQHQPYEWPVNHPHAPTPPQFLDETMMILPECAKLPPAEMPSLTDPSSPSRKVPPTKKRKRECQEEDDKVYIKKPPNAFMIFRKEQRENVMAQWNIRDSAVANKVLGHMWKSLSEKEQEKYYQLADAEKRLHTQLHPNWSCTDNYVSPATMDMPNIWHKVDHVFCVFRVERGGSRGAEWLPKELVQANSSCNLTYRSSV